MEKIVVEDKEKDAAFSKLVSLCPLDNCYYIENEEEGNLFKSKKSKIIAVRKSDVRDYIKNYLLEIGNLMEIQIHSEIHEKDDILNVNIVSDNSPILIGREGKNIEALQLLLRQSLYRQTGIRIKINVDVSDYKLKKQKRLEREIKTIAHEVLNSKIDAKLDPMSAYDRKIVHLVASKFEELETESLGESPNRYVMIKYRKEE